MSCAPALFYQEDCSAQSQVRGGSVVDFGRMQNRTRCLLLCSLGVHLSATSELTVGVRGLQSGLNAWSVFRNLQMLRVCAIARFGINGGRRPVCGWSKGSGTWALSRVE